MSVRMLVGLGLLSLAGAVHAQALAPGALLAPGMRLVYAAQGHQAPPWIVESVDTRVAFDGREPSTHLRIQKGGEGSEIEEIRQARAGGMLLAHAGTWKTSRPVRPGRTLEERDAAGRLTARYEAGMVALETISGRRVPVVRTTVTSFDASGNIKKRLRERYAVGLATATGGVFEVPDAAAPGGWKTTLAFELVEITAAPRAVGRGGKGGWR